VNNQIRLEGIECLLNLQHIAHIQRNPQQLLVVGSYLWGMTEIGRRHLPTLGAGLPDQLTSQVARSTRY
jgi:hypothetical protein